MTENALVLPKELSVPTLPKIVLEVNRLIADEASGTRELGELIAKDVALSGRVLRIANSAFYGLPSRCASTAQACAFLGKRVLRTIVTQVAAIEAFGAGDGRTGRLMEETWRHSVLTAQTTSFVAMRAARKGALAADEHYVCGLLHEVGRFVLLTSLGAEYAEMMEEAAASATPLHALELRRFGYDHTTIGAIVASRWSLPEPVVNAVRKHHDVVATADEALLILRLADDLVNLVPIWDPVTACNLFGDGTQDRLGLKGDAVEEILEFVQNNQDVEL